MKTFKDLEFKKHATSILDTHAKIEFNNSYGVSVITGSNAYTTKDKPYEVAVLFEGELTYSSGITDDVLGYQTESDVTNVMRRVQELN